MRSAARCAIVLAAVLTALLGVFAPAAGAATDATAEHVVIVGVPGLVWSDLDATRTPQLWDLAGHSAIGALSVRAARGTSCLLDGWATLGPGNRARFPGATLVESDLPDAAVAAVRNALAEANSPYGTPPAAPTTPAAPAAERPKRQPVEAIDLLDSSRDAVLQRLVPVGIGAGVLAAIVAIIVVLRRKG